MNVFDFDGTIYNGDSSIDFYTYCLLKHPNLIIYLPIFIFGVFLYKFGYISKTELKSRYFSFMRGLKDPVYEIEKFWECNICKIYPWFMEVHEETDVVISASPEFLLKKACSILQIKWLIASNVDIKTGKFMSNNCYGVQKVIRFREIFKDVQVEKFYTDSLSDKPMIDIARISYLVNKGKVTRYS